MSSTEEVLETAQDTLDTLRRAGSQLGSRLENPLIAAVAGSAATVFVVVICAAVTACWRSQKKLHTGGYGAP